MIPRILVALLVVPALLSCSTGEPGPAPTPSAVAAVPGGKTLATPGARAAIPEKAMLQPLRALGPCKQTPQGEVDRSVEGLVLPEGTIVTSVADADPLTNVQGYIPQTPVQIRVFYQQHESLQVVSVEDEGFESEVLVEAGGYRTFVKSQAVCELGSAFVAIVSPVAATP